MRLHHLAGALALAGLTLCAPAWADGLKVGTGTFKPRSTGSSPLSPLDIRPARARMADLVLAAARHHGVPGALAYAVAEQESGFDPRARNGAAVGLMQIQPGTARDAGCRGPLTDPRANADCGGRILAVLLRDGHGSWRAAAAHFNAGRFAHGGAGRRYAALVLRRARRVA